MKLDLSACQVVDIAGNNTAHPAKQIDVVENRASQFRRDTRSKGDLALLLATGQFTVFSKLDRAQLIRTASDILAPSDSSLGIPFTNGVRKTPARSRRQV
jgi:hypothetical protein